MKTESKAKSDDDAALVKRVTGGDAQAFDALTRRHLQRCYRLARKFGLKSEDAADIVQDTFLAAYAALNRFDYSVKFSTWLTRIHINKLLNYRRGLYRAKRFFWRDPGQVPIIETTASESTPESELETSEIQELFSKAMNKLPDKQRLIFILFEMENHTAREIASFLQIPEGTVHSRLRAARLFLGEHLRDYL